MSGFLSPILCLQDSSMLSGLVLVTVHSFTLMCSIPFGKHTTIYLSILWLMIAVFSLEYYEYIFIDIIVQVIWHIFVCIFIVLGVAKVNLQLCIYKIQTLFMYYY